MKKKVLAVILTVFMSCQSAIVYAGELEEVFSDPGIESVEEEVVEDEFTDGEIQFDTEENEETSEELINDGEEIPDVEDTEENVYPAEENYLIYGDFTYTVSNDQVTVRGYKGSATTIEVPEQIDGKTVVGVGERSFENCTFLEEITLPEGLEYIGYDFIRGTNIKRIEIPSSVKRVGEYYVLNQGALDGAQALEEVIFSEGMKEIPHISVVTVRRIQH